MSWVTTRKVSLRVVVATLLFAALVGFGLKPYFVTFLVADRGVWARHLERFPDHRVPGYVELLRAAGAKIPPGARVAIVYPTLDWGSGYSYAYYRAEYFLAGRIVVPLSWSDRARPERISEAEYVVVYRTEPPASGWEILLQTGDGVVARRIR